MALEDIVGQERALEILRRSIVKNRLAHAYLFTGEDGIGKKLTAINFAKTLNCQNNLTPHTSRLTPHAIDCCDECPSCTKIDRTIHPDVFLIAPENGQIKIRAIRKLGESLSYKAFEGKWKIAVVDSADALNQSAANAFLKTLEEPPHQSLLVLISSLPELIPSTVRSRCQRINFLPLSHKKMDELLRYKHSKEGLKIHSKQAMLISMLSGGRPGWALSNDLIERRDRTFDEFKSLLGGIEEDLWIDRSSMEEWFDWVQLLLRDVAVYNATGRPDLLINQDKEKEIKNISKKAELQDILKLSDALYNIKDALRFNLNKQLTLYHTYFLLKKTFG
ncbi:MAG: DNA polymerase III subunit delta' [Thermodesulfovibrionia bacterium]|nr:MAG: DNA polymerase III subunit delta' [Thermodesulfovibrionia bacterium]